MAHAQLVRIQEKGQVTLPAGARRRLGIKKGDVVAVTETAEGLLIVPQAVIAANDIENMRRVLEEKGFSLEELIESGREIRGELLREKYGIESDSNA